MPMVRTPAISTTTVRSPGERSRTRKSSGGDHPQHFSEKECSFHIDYGLELLFHIGGVTLPLARVPQLGCSRQQD
jgi:hypothetical protein